MTGIPEGPSKGPSDKSWFADSPEAPLPPPELTPTELTNPAGEMRRAPSPAQPPVRQAPPFESSAQFESSAPFESSTPFESSPTAPVGPPSVPLGARYLPQVAPPEAHNTAPLTSATAPEKSSSPWGWRALVMFLAGGLVASFGFAAAMFSDRIDVEQPVGEVEAAGPRPEPPDTDEPAAYVSQLLGPSVVQLRSGSGVGSGVVYDEGLILTNFHVVEGSNEVEVTLATGVIVPGQVIGTDANTDVAVVRIENDLAAPSAELAVGVDVEVGQFAVAIGSPFDLQQTVTAGIVSAIDRPVPNSRVSVVAMIQTDAPINPGNSGGALADRFGRVIGINTAIQTGGLSNTNAGVGFAIPIDTAIRVANLLVAGEPILPGFLGVSGDQPPPGELGVLLSEITAGSAAEFAGLEVGDRVISLNDAPVTDIVELAGLVQSNQAGDTVAIEIRRNGSPLTLDVTLGSRPDDE